MSIEPPPSLGSTDGFLVSHLAAGPGEARLVALGAAVSRALDAGSDDDAGLAASLVRALVPRLAPFASVDLVRPDGGLEPAAARGLELGAEGALPEGRAMGFACRAVVTGEPAWFSRAERRGDDDAWSGAGAGDAEDGDAFVCRRLGLGALLAVPFASRGVTLGALTLGRARPGSFSPEEVAFAVDVGARLGAALRLARLEREARLGEARRDEFLRALAHELKTPLTALELTVTGLARDAARGRLSSDSREGTPEKLRRAEGQLERLAVVVDDLLDAAENDGALSLRRSSFDLVDAARAVVSSLAPLAERTATPLELAAPAPLVGTWDRAKIERMLLHLVGNALRHGARRPVRIALSREGEGARLRVSDEGEGVAPPVQARLFDRFERPAGRPAGLGLGLFVARRIAEAHGGRISLESAPGLGATFTVDLPLGA